MNNKLVEAIEIALKTQSLLFILISLKKSFRANIFISNFLESI